MYGWGHTLMLPYVYTVYNDRRGEVNLFLPHFLEVRTLTILLQGTALQGVSVGCSNSPVRTLEYVIPV